MKKTLFFATLASVSMAMLLSCSTGDKEGFKTTDNGLHYKMLKVNKDAQAVQDGDMLVGRLEVKFDTVTVFSNIDDPTQSTRILQVLPSFDGDIYEGLLMMHVGDEAMFDVEMDSLASHVEMSQLPPFYEHGKGMKIHYHLIIDDIVPASELAQEQNNYMEEMKRLQGSEAERIAEYVKANNITAKPNANGVYIIVNKKGNGQRVAAGTEVSMNYTGRLLDGTIFDSSREKDAREGNIYAAGRPYEPLTYQVGKMPLIPGWEEGVMGQTAGSRLTLIIPSAMAYGSQSVGGVIPPYSPLVFDIEILSVATK
ncbi:MAG: FKBP-type peptidyl-prolyl cis-trans isomerase [Bacteroidales bacterium]|nr:FKBP-type peptidyl-prolyl cis-trans isomerase [Bacteroidales bacterium]